jgi:hypothetical protein
MNVTHHDIGRIALDREGDRWEILEVDFGESEFSILARLDHPMEIIETTFLPDGRHEIYEDEKCTGCDWDLVAWEDEEVEK